jgi:general secretion pathway protein D
LTVAADERTNSIILQGPERSIETMRSVIESLDIPRAQVYVEAIVAEVSATRAAELGVQWRTDTPESGVLGGIILPGTTAGNIQGLTTDESTLGTGLSLGYLEAGSARVLLRALANDGSSNILSTPSLVTLDNEEAEVQIGQNVPIVTGIYTNTGSDQGVTNPFQTIERRDVGVMLKVKPQITQGEVVRLALEQEVSAVSPSTSGADISFDKRQIKTSVLVRDGEMIVIGGLLNRDIRQSTQKVPVVGDIPGIGDAARDRRSDVTNTNVLVFLRPRVIREARVAAAITEDAVIDLRPDRNPPPQPVPLLPGERTPPLPSDVAPSRP